MKYTPEEREFYKKFPRILYKFRDWSILEHREPLESQLLYFNSADQFNDPFDVSLPIRYDKMNDLTINAIAKFQMKIEGEGLPRHFRRQRLKEINDLDFVKNSEFRTLANEKQLQKIRNTIGILSFSKLNNHLLMWSHYANKHTGFCIGYDSFLLDRAVKIDIENHGGGLGKVFYTKNYPELIPDFHEFSLDKMRDLFTQQIFTKSLDWRYEKEFRLIRFEFSRQKLMINPKVFKEIIYGCQIPREHKREIEDMIQSNSQLRHIQRFDAIQSNNGFEVRIKPIN